MASEALLILTLLPLVIFPLDGDGDGVAGAVTEGEGVDVEGVCVVVVKLFLFLVNRSNASTAFCISALKASVKFCPRRCPTSL